MKLLKNVRVTLLHGANKKSPFSKGRCQEVTEGFIMLSMPWQSNPPPCILRVVPLY